VAIRHETAIGRRFTLDEDGCMTRADMKQPFWYALSPSNREYLQAMGTLRHYPTGAVLVSEGDETNFAVVILEGCVKVSLRAAGGYETVLGLRDPGDVVGEQAGTDGQSRSATLSAMTPVEALLLPGPQLRRYLARNADVAALLHRTISARLREADRNRAAAGSEPVPKRLATLLLSLSKKYGVPIDTGGVLIEVPLAQSDLAGLILTSPRTIGRVIEQWRDEKIILTGRRSIVLLSPENLRAMANA
jgi:CRP/FNR family cyclic AMP-dependent transcriptional regulator